MDLVFNPLLANQEADKQILGLHWSIGFKLLELQSHCDALGSAVQLLAERVALFDKQLEGKAEKMTKHIEEIKRRILHERLEDLEKDNPRLAALIDQRKPGDMPSEFFRRPPTS